MTRHANPDRRSTLQAALALALASWALPPRALAQIKDGSNPEASPNWVKLRDTLFRGRTVRTLPAGDPALTLDVPVRAADAAVVPVALRAALPAGDTRRIQRLYLIIDANPSPVSAVIDLPPGGAAPELETRVRIDEYTFVRAVAELSDQSLVMTTRFVKASGGCSAPAGKDPVAALAGLGRMRLRVDGQPNPGQPLQAQLMIQHPNHSGMAMDQLTRQFTPSHFVREVRVQYGQQTLLTAELDFSISENPHLRFRFTPRGPGELKAEIVDSHDQRFQTTLALNALAP